MASANQRDRPSLERPRFQWRPNTHGDKSESPGRPQRFRLVVSLEIFCENPALIPAVMSLFGNSVRLDVRVSRSRAAPVTAGISALFLREEAGVRALWRALQQRRCWNSRCRFVCRPACRAGVDAAPRPLPWVDHSELEPQPDPLVRRPPEERRVDRWSARRSVVLYVKSPARTMDYERVENLTVPWDPPCAALPSASAAAPDWRATGDLPAVRDRTGG